jgi:hypothetical protein
MGLFLRTFLGTFKEFKENIRKYDFKENQEYQGLYLLMKYKNQAVAE